ncbi:ribonuclease Y [candidate division WWE3 bacterium]|uniref:Ribonuclease Y n=1 Tax=candidate division WWE3 bacterium TaxID=2053526 RepID=A0A955RPV7_UNCKA|nr:ribonuclease Y [candidate division WWE3 bacterium]
MFDNNTSSADDQNKSVDSTSTNMTDAKEIIVNAKDEALRIKEEAEREAHEIRERAQKQHDEITRLHQRLTNQIEENESTRKELLETLEKSSSLSRTESEKKYFEQLEEELKQEAARRIKESEEAIKAESDKRAQEILVTSLQRVMMDHISELTTAVVKLPNEDMVGPIIGKEGRNIKAFEQASGVDVEIGETPGVITLSSIDPVRREVARRSLEKLIADGRIQPARIEEIVEKTRADMDEEIMKIGEEHAMDAKVSGLPPEIIKLLGRLKYRTSYGQNMHDHNLEVVNIGRMLAAELGADVEVVKKACLLHDIGKAVTSEVEGGHAEVGAEICRRYGVEEEVVVAFEGHHTDNFQTIEAVIMYIADAISGARPGARREDFEAYIERIKELESIAEGFRGVEKAYAISAGREVRVIVRPAEVSDADMVRLAHEIGRKIRDQIQNFPGQIKVNVIRELRAQAFVQAGNSN